MSEQEEPPYIHDWYAESTRLDGERLSIRVEHRRYSWERGEAEVTESGVMCFLGIIDNDAPAPPSVQRVGPRGPVSRFVWRVLGLRAEDDPSFVKTVRQIIEQVEEQGSQGEPLNDIESTDSGYVLSTAIGGYYFVKATAIAWIESD